MISISVTVTIAATAVMSEEFEVECPLCGTEITVDEETVLGGTIPCPNCGEMLEFEIEEECDCCDED